MNYYASIAIAIITFLTFSSTSFAQEKDSTITVKVKGITCGTDCNMIKSSVEKIDGISSCTVAKQGTTSSFEIKYNTSKLTEKEIYSAIENTGSCENPSDKPYTIKQ